MPKLYRDAETVPAHHETPDVAELRRLAEAATPGPWSTAAFQLVIDVARRIDVGMCGHRDDAAFIAAANPATVLALLDAAAERDALAAAVERVRALADEWTYIGWDDGSHAYGTDCVVQALDYAAAQLRRALDEEPQP